MKTETETDVVTAADIAKALVQLKRSEKGARAVREFKKFRESLWGLDSQNQDAILILIGGHFELPGTLSEALE